MCVQQQWRTKCEARTNVECAIQLRQHGDSLDPYTHTLCTHCMKFVLFSRWSRERERHRQSIVDQERCSFSFNQASRLSTHSSHLENNQCYTQYCERLQMVHDLRRETCLDSIEREEVNRFLSQAQSNAHTHGSLRSGDAGMYFFFFTHTWERLYQMHEKLLSNSSRFFKLYRYIYDRSHYGSSFHLI